MHAEPTARTDVRRHEEIFRLSLRLILRARRRVEPERDAPIAMMIDRVRREDLAAAHAKIRRAVRQDFFRFRERETDLAYGVTDVFSHRSVSRTASWKLRWGLEHPSEH